MPKSTRILMTGYPVIHKTRFTELGYWHLPGQLGFWQCVDLTGHRPTQVGTQYATKAELLANLEAYASDYGCDGAMPMRPVRPIDRAYDGQAHHMAKAAQSLVLMLTNLDYSIFELPDAAKITAKIHGLINFIEAQEEVSLAEKMVREGLCLACGRPDSGSHLAGCPMRHREVRDADL